MAEAISPTLTAEAALAMKQATELIYLLGLRDGHQAQREANQEALDALTQENRTLRACIDVLLAEVTQQAPHRGATLLERYGHFGTQPPVAPETTSAVS